MSLHTKHEGGPPVRWDLTLKQRSRGIPQKRAPLVGKCSLLAASSSCLVACCSLSLVSSLPGSEGALMENQPSCTPPHLQKMFTDVFWNVVENLSVNAGPLYLSHSIRLAQTCGAEQAQGFGCSYSSGSSCSSRQPYP